jgi:hypothetical protein
MRVIGHLAGYVFAIFFFGGLIYEILRVDIIFAFALAAIRSFDMGDPGHA